MKSLRSILVACFYVSVGLLGALQFFDKAHVDAASDGLLKDLILLVLNNNLPIAIVCAIFVTILPTADHFSTPYELQKVMRRKLMETMKKELFAGHKGDLRITIFKDANIFRRIGIYCRQANTGIRHIKRGDYIYAKERLGSQFEDAKTYLYFSKQNRKKCEGVAGVVRQSREEKVVHDLPDIEDVDLDQVNLKGKSARDNAVRVYMSEGYIRDFATLRRINIKGRHFYSNILQNKDGDIKGVLIIDSTQARSPFDEATVVRLSHYVEMFKPTL